MTDGIALEESFEFVSFHLFEIEFDLKNYWDILLCWLFLDS